MSKSNFLNRLLKKDPSEPRRVRLGSDVGVVGLGLIGIRVAERLRDAGCRVWVWSRSPKPVPNFLSGPAEVADHARVLQLFVSDGPALLNCLRTMQRSLTPEHVILNHATVGIEETKSAAELVASAGAAFLDAPFTGSRDAAAAGELVYYISGDSAVLERQVDLLRISSRKILMFEQMGQATALKLATNLITASTVEALSEALALVRSAGVPGEKLQAALAENLARSGVSDFKLPTILAKDFEARFSLANMVKDMRLAVEAAKNAGFDLPAAEAFLRSADKIEGSRGLAEDFSVISEAFAPNADSPAPGSIPPV